MVHNDDVGFLRAASHPREEARLVDGALLAEAGVVPRVDLLPDRPRLREIRELRAIAGLRLFRPLPDTGEPLRLRLDVGAEAGEVPLGRDLLETVEAQIVLATLHERGADRSVEDGREQRDVALEELIL